MYDEGSTDNSLEIAQANAANHPNVRLIQHSNRSIGESLNYAFPLAKGEYVQVIDTDDYLEPNTIAPLLQRIYDEQLDIMRFKYQNVDEDTQDLISIGCIGLIKAIDSFDERKGRIIQC